MDFRPGEDHAQVRAMVRDLCASEFAPHAARWDAEGAFPAEAMAQLAELGFYGLLVPEELGGVGYDAVAYAIALEELARVSAALSVMISVHNSVCAAPIVKFGTPEQKDRFLAQLTSGTLGAFSLSEPDAGSDAASLACAARRDGDDYVLNGTKNWVTNGAQAGVILLFARTGPAKGPAGISAFLVTPDLPGFAVGKHEDKMGIRGSVTTEIALQDCRVPAANLLCREGEGYAIAMSTLEGGRVGIAAQALGIARASYEAGVRHAKARTTFGKKLY